MSGNGKKRRMATATIAVLAERFPKCFAVSEGRRRPLKVGIAHDIHAAMPDSISPAGLFRALHRYTRSAGYLRHMTVGTERLDLDGNAAGIVTEADAAYAVAKLSARKTKIKAPEKPNNTTPAGSPLVFADASDSVGQGQTASTMGEGHMGGRNWTSARNRERLKRQGGEAIGGGQDFSALMPAQGSSRPQQLSKQQLRAQAEQAVAGYAGEITRCPPAKRR
jgi:ProP effector